jgi:hypothetical protein
MVEELQRYLAGQPLRWRITPQMAEVSSHRPANVKPKLTLPQKNASSAHTAATV